MCINPRYKLIIYLNKNSTHFQVKTWSSNLTINKICFRGIVGLSGGVKRKLKVHAIATKFQAVKDVKKGELSKSRHRREIRCPTQHVFDMAEKCR